MRALARSVSHRCRVTSASSSSSWSSATRAVSATTWNGTNDFATPLGDLYAGFTPTRAFWQSPVASFATSATVWEDGSASGSTIRPQPSLKPAILVCTSKVVSPEQRKDYEAWLTEGKTLIDAVLKDKDCQAGLSVPAGRAAAAAGRCS